MCTERSTLEVLILSMLKIPLTEHSLRGMCIHFVFFILTSSRYLLQCYQHFRHRRRHQALDIFTQGQGYQAYYFGGERCQEKKSRGAVDSLKARFLFLRLCLICPSPAYDMTNTEQKPLASLSFLYRGQSKDSHTLSIVTNNLDDGEVL